MGLPPESQSCWAGDSNETAAGFTVGPTVGGLVNRSSGLNAVWSLVDGTASSTLFNRVVPGQEFASGFTAGTSDSEPLTRCMDVGSSHQVPGRTGNWMGP